MKCSVCGKQETEEIHNCHGDIFYRNPCDCDKPITKRDYFAGLAMQALSGIHDYNDDSELCESSFKIADAMIRASNKR